MPGRSTSTRVSEASRIAERSRPEEITRHDTCGAARRALVTVVPRGSFLDSRACSHAEHRHSGARALIAGADDRFTFLACDQTVRCRSRDSAGLGRSCLSERWGLCTHTTTGQP